MTGIVQTPQPGEQGVTPEGETLSLVGSASSFWDVCELIFNKELLCRTGRGSFGFCNTLNYNTSRIQGVTVLQTGNDLDCGFEMRSISSNDTGDWSIIMQAISGGSLVMDSKTVEVKVGRGAVISLASFGGEKTNESHVDILLNHELTVHCSAVGGRPEVRSFNWNLSYPTTWTRRQGVTQFSSADQWGFRNSDQALMLSSNYPGTSFLFCGPVQAGYSPPSAMLTIEVVESYSGSGLSTASMHPYTVALRVLASIALFIVLALIVFAFLTKTFCFATRGEPREERGGRAAGQRDQVDKGGKHNIKVDTSYVVGQDYHPEEHEQDFHQQTEVQYSSGRGSMAIQEGPPSSSRARASPTPSLREGPAPPARRGVSPLREEQGSFNGGPGGGNTSVYGSFGNKSTSRPDSLAYLAEDLSPTILPRGRGG